MKIHSDILTGHDLTKAADAAHVTFVRWDEKGSRSRARAWDLILTGSSNHNINFSSHPEKAATWDEWGIFLGHLYAIDPDLKTPYYIDQRDFDMKTQWRFETEGGAYYGLEHFDQHTQHKWEYVMPFTFQCKCNAVRDNTPVEK